MNTLDFAKRDVERVDKMVVDSLNDGWQMWHWWGEQPTAEYEVMTIGMMVFWRPHGHKEIRIRN